MSITKRLWLLATQLRARWRLIRNHGDELNRRAVVENVLLTHAKLGIALEPDQCRALAYKLGTPSVFSSCAVPEKCDDQSLSNNV